MNWSIQEKAFKKRIYFALLERRIINQAAAIHVTSSLEECQMRHWRFATPVITVPNGMDLAPFAELPLRGKFRQSLSIPPTDTLSLFVGRLHKEKRLDLIISAFAVLVQQFPNAHLLIVGPDQDGSGKTAQEQVRFLGLADRVHFSGQLTGADLVRAYVDADMLVLLSHRENFGMVVVEAMAGRPTCASGQRSGAGGRSGAGPRRPRSRRGGTQNRSGMERSALRSNPTQGNGAERKKTGAGEICVERGRHTDACDLRFCLE